MRTLLLSVVLAFPLAACHDTPTQEEGSGSLHPETEPGFAQSAVLARTDLGTLGGNSSYAADVNNDQIVVGWSLLPSGVSRAFRWTLEGGMHDLGTLAGDEWSVAVSITPDGQILGMSGAHGAWRGTPVVWDTAGVVHRLDIPLLPGGEFGQPSDMNGGGLVAGWDAIVGQHAWAWTSAGGKIDLTRNAGSDEGAASRVNNAGVVVGTNKGTGCTRDPECWRSFLWSADGGYLELGAPANDPQATTTGLGLNANRTVVGWSQLPAGRLTAYRWTRHDGFQLLPSPASYAYALGVNARNTAVGAAYDPADDAIQPALWPSGGSFVELSPDDPNPGVAVAMNDNGRVVGWASLDCCGGKNHAMLWTLGSAMALPDPPASSPAKVSLRSADADGTAGCLADPESLISRGTLFDCVKEFDAPLDGTP